jgi:membrane-associated protein
VLWGVVYVGLGNAASAALRHSAHLLGPTVTGVAVAAVLAVLAVRAVRRRRTESAARLALLQDAGEHPVTRAR